MAQSFLGMKGKLKTEDYRHSDCKVFGPKERLAWIAAQESDEPLVDITETEDATAADQLPGHMLKAKIK